MQGNAEGFRNAVGIVINIYFHLNEKSIEIAIAVFEAIEIANFNCISATDRRIQIDKIEILHQPTHDKGDISFQMCDKHFKFSNVNNE